MNLSFLGREPTALILAGSARKIGPGVGPDAPRRPTPHILNQPVAVNLLSHVVVLLARKFIR